MNERVNVSDDGMVCISPSLYSSAIFPLLLLLLRLRCSEYLSFPLPLLLLSSSPSTLVLFFVPLIRLVLLRMLRGWSSEVCGG